MIELNPTLNALRKNLESDPVRNKIPLKLLGILEMLVDRREEDSLLIKERLKKITENWE